KTPKSDHHQDGYYCGDPYDADGSQRAFGHRSVIGDESRFERGNAVAKRRICRKPFAERHKSRVQIAALIDERGEVDLRALRAACGQDRESEQSALTVPAERRSISIAGVFAGARVSAAQKRNEHAGRYDPDPPQMSGFDVAQLVAYDHIS